MEQQPLQAVIHQICTKDPRYAEDAYLYVIESLDSTVKSRMMDNPGCTPRHLTGQELAEGIHQSANYDFGPLALTVLHQWGITKTSDFGEIVYNLIEAGRLCKNDTDKKSDFDDVYDFEEIFDKPFLPRELQKALKKK